MIINTTLSPSLNIPIPFEHGKYQGAITCNIHKNDKAHLISVKGERISLETFTSPYSEDFRKKFTQLAADKPETFFRPEFISLQKIFQNPENVKNHLNGKINTDDQIIKRLDRDSKRPLQGDVFTGFGVVDNQTGEVIGRAAVGSVVEPGESQFGLILRSDYHGKQFGKETVILMAALALVFFENKFQVGPTNGKLPVKRFTATALNNNIESRKLLQLGCKPIKTLPSGWFQRFVHFLRLDRLLESIGYPLNMRKLYEIKGDNLRTTLSKFIDINKLEVVVNSQANSTQDLKKETI
jgi:RimJ/RimL family protein N-acetyltransferase